MDVGRKYKYMFGYVFGVSSNNDLDLCGRYSENVFGYMIYVL